MSGAATVFNAQIKSVDSASGTMRRIAESMRGLIESTKGLMAATKGLTKANAEGAAAHTRFLATVGAHIRLLHSHIGSVNAGIVGIRNHIARLLPMIAGLGAGASLAGLFELTKSVSEASVEFEATIQKLGLTAKEFGGLSYAARVSAVPIEVMTGGFEKLNRTMGMTAVGRNKAAAALFHHLGISLRDAQHHIRSTAEVMPQLADAFMKTHDPAMRAFMATTLFGKAGQELLPMLMQGSKAMKEFAAEGSKLIFAPSAGQRKSLREFEDQWIGLDIAMKGLKTEIGAELAPVLAPLIAMAKEWVLVNRDWIAQGIADKVKLLGDAISQIPIRETVEQFTEWVRSTIEVINQLGGMKTVLGAIALAMGSPLIGAVVSLISIFGALGKALFALGSILWANPILAGIAALAIEAYLLYENWNWVKEKISGIFNWFGSQHPWVKNLLTLIAPFIFIPVRIYENWGGIKEFFTNLWAGVTAIFESAIARIRPIIDRLMGFGDWVRHSSLGNLFGGSTAAAAAAAAAPANVPTLPSPTQMPTFDGGDVLYSNLLGGWWNHNRGPDGPAGAAPSLYRPDGPAARTAASPPATGDVNVKIDASNLQPGTTVTTSSSGIAKVTETNVGYMSPMPRRSD